MLKIGIIGLGVISQVHIDAILKSKKADLIALCDIDTNALIKFKENVMIDKCNFYTDLDVMLENENLDVIHITTPHYCHFSMIKKCVDKGINVFTEKPVVLNYKEGIELKNYLEKKEEKVGVCFQNRYNPTTLLLKEYVDQKILGKPIAIVGNVFWNRTKDYYIEADWRGKLNKAGSGTLINQSIHTLDLMEYIVGPIKNIYGTAFSSLLKDDIEVEDTAMAILIYENGTRGMFNCTVNFPFNRPVEIEITFEKGILSFSQNRVTLIEEDKMTTLMEPNTPTTEKFYYGSQHFKCIEEFYDAIMNDTNNYISVSEGIKPIKIIDEILLNRIILK